MANIQIPNLPAVALLSGAELFEGVQSGTSVKISLNQLAAAIRFDTSYTIPILVSQGGTGVVTLTGYVKGSGTSPFTASSTIPNTDITGLGTMSTQNANAVAITGGSITGITDITVPDGGTGVSTLTGYVKGSGTSPLTASATIPNTDITGLGTMSTQNADAVSITDGTATLNSLTVYNATSAAVAINGDATTTLSLSRSSNDTTGVGLNFRKFRGTTAIPSAVVSGDTIGFSNYTAYDGATGLVASQVRGEVETYTGIGDLSGLIRFLTRPTGAGSSLEERFRFGSAGQLGIGGAVYGTAGQALVSGGASAAPSWSSVGSFTTVTATSTISDSAGNVRNIVNNAQAGAYVLVVSDNGKMINITTGGVTVNSGIFSAGQNITIYNNSAASQTITQGAGVTLRLAGSATTGNRTLALRGICTILCVASNEFVVSGAGVT